MSSNTGTSSTASPANERLNAYKLLEDKIASMTVFNRTSKQSTQSQRESLTTHSSAGASASIGRTYGGSSYPTTDSTASRFGRQPATGGQYRSGEREYGSNRYTSSSSSGKFAPNYRPQTYGAYNSKPRYSSYHDPLTKDPYLESKLRPNDAGGYRAAGVLAFRRVIGPDANQQVQFLFGREDDSTNSKKDGRLSFLGGKIKEELDLDSLFTAARKFVKESGALLSTVDELIEKIKEQNHGVLWIRDAKYALYFLELTTEAEVGIVELYSSAKADASAADADLFPMLELVWLEGRAFLDVLSRSSLRYQTSRFNESSLHYDSFTTITGRKYEMMNFTCFMLTREPATKKLREIVASKKADDQPTSVSPRPKLNESTSSKSPSIQSEVASETTAATEGSSSSSTSTK